MDGAPVTFAGGATGSRGSLDLGSENVGRNGAQTEQNQSGNTDQQGIGLGRSSEAS